MEIITPQYYSFNKPNKISNEIVRDNIILTIEGILNNNDIILITGEGGIGKTTFLNQFASHNKNNTIISFIKPINSFSSNIDIIIEDLICQIYFYLYQTEYTYQFPSNIETLKKLFTGLIRKTNRNKVFYVIIDGLEDIEEKNTYQLVSLFEIFPIGYNIKFIFSEFNEKIKNTFIKPIINTNKIKLNEYPFTPFSIEETKRYFQNIEIEYSEIVNINKICNSLPGNIELIKNLIDNGQTFEDIWNNVDIFTDLLRKEWDKIDLTNNLIINILSIIAFEDREYTVEEVSKILNETPDAILNIINSLNVLFINNNHIEYNSKPMKVYAIKLLDRFKIKCEEIILAYLLNNYEDIDSLIELPKRLDRNKDYAEVLKILSEENFNRIIDQKQSLVFVENQTELGITAAFNLKKYPDLFKLCLQKSIISEVGKSFILETEIESKIELGNYSEAFELALESTLKEEQFKYLVFIAKKRSENSLPIDDLLNDKIETLYSQIEFNYFKDNEVLIEICSNLMYSFPKLAIELFEKVSGTQDIENSDIGFAQLVILLRKLNSNNSDENETIKSVSSKIKDPNIKNLANAFSYMFGDKNPIDFITKIKHIDSTNEKLNLAKIYIEENPKSEDIHVVIDYVLSLLLLQSVDSPINASILEEITKPIPYIKSPTISKQLISKIEPFIPISKEKGPTIKHILFQLNLASNEIINNSGEAKSRYFEIAVEIDNIADLGIRTEALSAFFRSIKCFDNKSILENEFSFETESFDKLTKNFDELLNESAYHNKITKNIISNIAFVLPNEAITFCSKINTLSRRNSSIKNALNSYLKNDLENISISFIDIFYNNINDNPVKNKACISILDKFLDKDSSQQTRPKKITKYINEIKEFYSNINKCYAYCISIKLCSHIDTGQILLSELNEEIYNFWSSLEDIHEKIEFGFKFSSVYLKYNREIAQKYHDNSVNERDQFEFYGHNTIDQYLNTIRLTIKSYHGLFNAESHTLADCEKLITYIQYLPSKIEQTRLLAELAIRVFSKSDREIFNLIVEKHILDFISMLFGNSTNHSKSEKTDLFLSIGLVIFLYNNDLFEEYTTKLESQFSEFCFDSICDYLIHKRIPFDSYDTNSDEEIKMDYSEALTVIKILHKINTDNIIDKRLNDIRIAAKRNCFPKENIVDISNKIKILIDIKLPDPMNIQHNGYKILANAYLLQINKVKIPTEWNNLIVNAETISNQSDRALVICLISKLAPQSVLGISRHEMLQKALESISKIKSYVARVERYSDIKSIMKEINPDNCKIVLKKAIEESVFENNFELFTSQNSIIDFAHEMDPSFADSLIKIIDDDPARRPLAERLKKKVKTLTFDKRLIENDELPENYEVSELNHACGIFIQKLNSKRVQNRKLEVTADWLKIAKRMPYSETFTIYLAYISNANSRFHGKTNAKLNLQPIFDNLIRSIQIIRILTKRKRKNQDLARDIHINNYSDTNILVTEGTEPEALQFILNWVRENSDDYLLICDPYFTSEELSFIKDIHFSKSDIEFTILAEHESDIELDLKKKYIDKWKSICDQPPPSIRIIIVSSKVGGKIISPNHDRWYISKNGGLRMGTSLNGLASRNSEISKMNSEESKIIFNSLYQKYVLKQEKYFGGSRLSYMDFDLF